MSRDGVVPLPATSYPNNAQSPIRACARMRATTEICFVVISFKEVTGPSATRIPQIRCYCFSRHLGSANPMILPTHKVVHPYFSCRRKVTHDICSSLLHTVTVLVKCSSWPLFFIYHFAVLDYRKNHGKSTLCSIFTLTPAPI